MFAAIDRTSKFAFVQLEKKAGKMAAARFLRDLIAALPYRIHTILTDNGIQFTNRKQDRFAMEHIFDRVCDENGIEHRLTKVNHPWSSQDQEMIRGDHFPEGRPGRAHEPHDQGRNRQAPPLRGTGSTRNPPRRRHRSL